MSITPTRSLSIGGKELFVFDDLLAGDDVRELFAVLNEMEYHANHVTSRATERYREWICDFEIDDFQGHVLHQRTQAAIGELYPDATHRCIGVHCNNICFGDHVFVHRDMTDVEGLTALYYANVEWDPDHGGETLFYDDNRDVRAAVAPRPGRLAVFDPGIYHRGSVPSRLCDRMRLTISAFFERTSMHAGATRAADISANIIELG